MKVTLIILISLALIASLLIGGCVQQQTPPVPEPTPITTPMPTPIAIETQACSLVPGPTQMLPSYEYVSVSVDRNTVSADPTIAVSFNGGKGNGMVVLMNVTVVRSDCVTEHQDRNYPVVGDTVTLMGTTREDRVIVVMTMTSGDQYTIIDALYPFPK
jgi:hypothetical protein